MRRVVLIVVAVASLILAQRARAQTTQPLAPSPATVQSVPTTRPANASAEQMLRQMLQPPGQGAQPLKPLPDLPPAADATSGAGAVAPDVPPQRVLREGTLLLDRIGRLTPAADGKTFELTLEADGGNGLADPPLVLLPNRRLMQLEDQVLNSYQDQKIRVSGEITEYRGRNYLLLQRWNLIPDSIKPLQ
jgi:hypothetical protein